MNFCELRGVRRPYSDSLFHVFLDVKTSLSEARSWCLEVLVRAGCLWLCPCPLLELFLLPQWSWFCSLSRADLSWLVWSGSQTILQLRSDFFFINGLHDSFTAPPPLPPRMGQPACIWQPVCAFLSICFLHMGFPCLPLVERHSQVGWFIVSL